jgi:cysteine desulfuration protein SufE
MPEFDAIRDDYLALDEAEDRYRLLIDLGRALPPMPDALKTAATRVRGCSADVWVYPVEAEGRLTFLADSNAHITKGIVALIVTLVNGRSPRELVALDVEGELAPFELSRQLSANRTQGVPNMIALVRGTAGRLAGDALTTSATRVP